MKKALVAVVVGLKKGIVDDVKVSAQEHFEGLPIERVQIDLLFLQSLPPEKLSEELLNLVEIFHVK